MRVRISVLGRLRTGIALVDEIARLADAADHQPDIDLRPNGVTVRLRTTTPDRFSSLSEHDLELARQISRRPANLASSLSHPLPRTCRWRSPAIGRRSNQASVTVGSMQRSEANRCESRAVSWRANDDPLCSFCGRKRSDGNRRLIAGPDGVFICDACVELCAEILEEERAR
jgi:hypothetical protein